MNVSTLFRAAIAALQEENLVMADESKIYPDRTVGPETTRIRNLRPVFADWGRETPQPQSGPPRGDTVPPLPGWPEGQESK